MNSECELKNLIKISMAVTLKTIRSTFVKYFFFSVYFSKIHFDRMKNPM